jgi:glycine betaine/proline transport system substrate-binding protein
MKLKIATALATTLAFATPSFAQDVVVGVPNWPSVTVTANVIKELAETKMGLKVELQTGTNPVIFEAMDKGSMQIHPEVWFPNQQGLFDKSAAKLEMGGKATTAVQGICVNKAAVDAGIADISDLTDPKKAALLDSDGNGKGEVFIGATGWASTTVEKAKAHGYGYDQVLDLVELDEGVAYSQLDTAIAAGKPWAGFCYKPHHLFTVHPEMVFLKEPAYDAAKWKPLTPEQDPKYLENSSVAMAWPPASIRPVFAKALETKAPQVASLIRNMDITADELGAFSYAVVIDKKDAAAVAAQWIAANPDRVAAWLK